MLLFSRLPIYALFLLILYKSWIFVKNHFQELRDFPNLYLSHPRSPQIRMLGVAVTVMLAGPALIFFPAMILRLIVEIVTGDKGAACLIFCIKLFAGLISAAGLAVFVSLAWEKSRFIKLASITLAAISGTIVILFLIIRIKYNPYFKSLFVIDDLAGLVKAINISLKTLKKTDAPLMFILRSIYFPLSPVLFIVLSHIKLTNIVNKPIFSDL